MNTFSDKRNCSNVCTFAAFLVSLVILIVLMVGADWGFFAAFFASAVLWAIGTVLLLYFVCRGVAEASETAQSPAIEDTPAPAPVPSTPAPAMADPVAAEPKAQAPEKAADPAPKAEPASKAAPEPAASVEGTKPEALTAARDGKGDDLKQIKGVGPKLEAMCNELGFYHFDQIAAWSADEVAWVDQNIKGFKGRVTRDNWVEQAKILASGGETEFSKRVEDGDVY